MFETETRDDIAVVVMRHGRANAMDLELCTGLAEELARLDGTAARAVVLTGAGRIFSAGVDLVRLLDGGPAYAESFVPALERLFEVAFGMSRPLVAAVNGHAVAGGCVLAACADVRVMVDGGATIGIPELRVGVPFPPLAVEVVRRLVTPSHLERLVLEGRTIDPVQAQHVGLVDELAAPDAVLQRAMALAADLGSIEPRAFGITKRQLHAPVLERAAAPGGQREAVGERWRDPDTLSAVRAYVERTLRR
ncbi:MAG: enoyl-CoA hydratase/isomerase family protein [Ectothiorhodospiraceae bacterium]|nr:enoyl-CoA hydratase/isomerase family protein [Ectothiorhodospiraceae bacterium]